MWNLKLILILCASAASLGAVERVRLIWHEDPARHAVIAWDGPASDVQYGQRGGDLSHSAPVTRSVQAKGMHNRFAHLHGLQPDTEYALRIGADEQGRSWWFRTAPDHPGSFPFIAGGDSRNHRDARRAANRMVANLRPLFVAFGGDMTDRDTPQQWQGWFDDWQLTTGADGRLIPIVAARGNHERRNETITDLFDVPHPDVHYATAIGGDFLRLYTLNSEIRAGGSQQEWLADDLQEHQDVHWKIAQYHRPMRPHVSRKDERIRQYRAWAPLFFRHGFDLVMECDAHCVKVTWPLRPSLAAGNHEGFVRDDEHGTVYAGEGCWGAPLRAADDAKPWTRASGSFNQFKWFHVHQDRIEMRTVLVDNAEGVGVVDDDDPFAAPDNLVIWEPQSGSVVTMTPRPPLALDERVQRSLQLIGVLPDIEAQRTFFRESTTVSIRCETDLPGSIHYRRDGRAPTPDDPVYDQPIVIHDDALVTAAWITPDGGRSLATAEAVHRIPQPVGSRSHPVHVPLESLEWIDQSAGWNETQRGAHIAGGPMRVLGETHTSGIGMHAVGHVRYALQPEWRHFVATAAIDDRARDIARATLRILADGQELYRSPEPLVPLARHHIDIAIPAGASELIIHVEDGGNGPHWDNVDLYDAGFAVAE